jgi:hypothetical protein
MKHILNDLSEQEKNSIREQHTGGMKVMTESFSKLINSKLGDVKPIVKEQFDGEIESPQDNVNSGYEELKSRLERYKNKMDRFLDELKSSGEGIDGRRFLKQIQRQSDQIFYDIDENSDKNINGFGELQDELLKYFRSKLK